MTKTEAKRIAFENETTTYGDLLKMVNEAGDLDKPSRVNKYMDRRTALQIMRDGLCKKQLTAVVHTHQYNLDKKCEQLSLDGLIMADVLYECGE